MIGCVGIIQILTARQEKFNKERESKKMSENVPKLGPDPKLKVRFLSVIKKEHEYFTKGKLYGARYVFPDTWPWMLMAWDNGDIGRYIHQGDYGEYEEITEGDNRNERRRKF